MKGKTPKRYKLVVDYLLKICDAKHHTYYNVTLSLSPEELDEWYKGNSPPLNNLLKSGRSLIVERSEWDDILEGRGQSNTAELIARDVKIFWEIEDIRNQKSLSIEKAVESLTENWPSDFGAHLGYEVVREIYKEYVPIFRFRRIPFRDGTTGKITWNDEDPFLNFPLRDAAAYELRQMKVLTGQYHIDRPTGILEEIHTILELPFEEDIEREIKIYQSLRNRAFGVTFIHSLRLVNRSMGYFANRFKNRSEKLQDAINYIAKKTDYDFKKLASIYRHYRLIEAEDNGQKLGVIFERMEKDLRNLN